jgi:hypothetical protein
MTCLSKENSAAAGGKILRWRPGPIQMQQQKYNPYQKYPGANSVNPHLFLCSDLLMR